MLKLFVTHTETNSADAFIRSPNDCVVNIRSALAEKHNISIDEILLTHNGNILANDCILSTIANEGPFLELTADRKIPIDFSIYNTPNIRHTYAVFPSVLPKDLDGPIRQLFNIHARRKFRLRSAAGPLDETRPLRDNGICDTHHVIVDLAYDLNVTDCWSGETRSLALFSSEVGEEMVNLNIDGERVLLNNTEINTAGDVTDALTAVGDVFESIALQSSCRRRVFALSDDTTSEHFVWPHDRLGRLKKGCQLSVPFVHESRRVSARKTFFDLQVGDDAVVDIEPLEVILTSATRKGHKVSLSRAACVRDLIMEAVTLFQLPSDQIRLKCHGRFIEDMVGARLDQAGVRHEDQVHVIPASTRVKVHVNDSIWKHHFPKKSVGFSDIAFLLCDEKKLDVIDTTLRSFHCMGCGRKLTLEQEEFQQVPASCCRVKSLELRLVRTRDFGVQGRTFSSEKQSSEQSSIEPPNGIRLRLRQFNMRDVVYVGSYDDTLGNIVAFLRRQNRLMGIKTIYADERELTAPPNWRKIKLRDCDLEKNQLLTIEFITYNHFRIEILSPTSQWPTCHLIWLQGREKSLEGIRWHLNVHSLFKIDQATMIFQLGTFYKNKSGQVSRSILSYNQSSNQSEFLDEDSGAVVAYTNSSHEVREMLFLGFGIRASPTHAPVLTFFMESKLFRLGDRSGDDAWTEIQNSDVRGGKFVMMLEGVLYHGTMFVQCTDGTFFDVVSGETFPDEETLRSHYPVSSDTKESSLRSFYRLFLFLKPDDEIPFFPIPVEKYIGYYLRRDVDVSLEDGILKCSDIPTNCELTWTRTIHVSSFQKKLSRLMKSVQ